VSAALPIPVIQLLQVLTVAVGAELGTELYCDCGLGMQHIELLTGQPAKRWLAWCARTGCRRERRAEGRPSCAAGAKGALDGWAG
jgi:hypothetical protein